MSKLISMICSWFESIVGKISWSIPPWLNYLYNRAVAKPRETAGIIAGIIIFLCGIVFSYHWYKSLPQPVRVIAQIIAPKITPLDKILVPDVLTINFGVITNHEFAARSVAPISLIGKEVTDGINLSPNLPGKWIWQSDNQLVFMPAQDWPAGQTYFIHFKKSFFVKGTKLVKWDDTFVTQPFTAQIENFKLYIDPLNAKERQAVAEINFNFPVDPASLENHIAFVWEASQSGDSDYTTTPLPYTIKFDEHKRKAYLRTDSIAIPSMERFLTLTVAKGVKAASSDSMITEPLYNKMLIADATSYFKVNTVATTIVRNQNDLPEQVLTIETTLGMTQSDLDSTLHVYLLPQDRPATMGEEAVKNYAWQNPGEVTPEILALSKPVKLNAIPADRDNATLHSYQYSTATPAYLYVQLDKGMKGMGDFTLANAYNTVLKAPDYPKEISFLHKGALLALGTEEKLSVAVRGLPAVKFTIARVLPDDVNHLITQTAGDFSNPYFKDYNFTQENISEIFSQIQQFDTSDPAKAQYTALDLGKYMAAKKNGNGPLGLFLLEAQGWDANENLPMDVDSKRLILITDLGLITKDNKDASHDVFVQSITKGLPVTNAAVSILGKNGVAILTRQTDAQGRAHFPSLDDFTNEREPTVYVVRNQNDVSFIPYNRSDRQLNFSKFDIGGVSTDTENQSALTAYVFSDRGIYRPGDTAHVAMIVKQPYAQSQPAGLPLEADVIDPRGVTVKTEKITLNDSGYLTFDFQTNALAQTGQYLVNLYIVKDNHPAI